MTAETLTLPLATDCVGHLEKRLARELEAEAEEWSECASALTLWEDEHLLDSPAEDMLARHQATVERLLQFGKLLSSVVEHPGFPDKKLAAMVSATHQMLQDKRVMWQGVRSVRAAACMRRRQGYGAQGGLPARPFLPVSAGPL